MSPVAYVTSASENEANCITRPIFRFAYERKVLYELKYKFAEEVMPHLVNLFEDGAKASGECISFLGQERVSCLCSFQP